MWRKRIARDATPNNSPDSCDRCYSDGSTYNYAYDCPNDCADNGTYHGTR